MFNARGMDSVSSKRERAPAALVSIAPNRNTLPNRNTPNHNTLNTTPKIGRD